jgi:hypothetical protein
MAFSRITYGVEAVQFGYDPYKFPADSSRVIITRDPRPSLTHAFFSRIKFYGTLVTRDKLLLKSLCDFNYQKAFAGPSFYWLVFIRCSYSV